MVLNQEQIKRLYDVFDFEDYEEIVCAEENNHWLKIYYINHKEDYIGCYEPYLAKHSAEDIAKYNYIRNGEK